MSKKDEQSTWPEVSVWEWLAVLLIFAVSFGLAYSMMDIPHVRWRHGGPFVGGASVGALLSLALVVGRRLLRERRAKKRAFKRAMKPWRELPASLFDAHPKPLFRYKYDELVLAGLRDGAFVQVTIGREDVGLGQRKVHIAVSGDGKNRLALARAGKPAIDDRSKTPSLPPLGDTPFDKVVRLAGSPTRTTAIMDQSTRAEVMAAIGGWQTLICLDADSPSFFLRDVHRCSIEQPLPIPSADMAQAIEGSCRLAQKVSIAPDQVLPGLRQNASKDPSPWVRCRNLQVLIEHYRDDAGLPGIIATAMHDEHQAVRAIASTFAGGQTAFRELSSLLAHAKGPDRLRADALDYLVQHFPMPQVRSLVETAVASSCEPMRTVALKAAATSGDAALVHLVCSMIKKGRFEHCERIVQWLASSKADCIEPALLDLLATGQSASALPALEAIAAIGTERSVGALLGLLGGRFGMAARAALDQIQARTKAIDAGRLSIVPQDAESGAVSLAGSQGEIEVLPPQRK
jgi:hypothetical protein